MMVLAMSSAGAASTRRFVDANGVRYWNTTFVGTPYGVVPDDARSKSGSDDVVVPYALLVEQPPEAVNKAHYHQVDQFQIVFEGTGNLGGHPLEKAAVHYTNAYTPYGPIVADKTGLHYFTLRAGYDPGARFMPERAAELRTIARNHREVVGDAPTFLTTDEVAELEETQLTDLISQERDGLAAWLYQVPPLAQITGPAPALGNGQFWVVMGGSLLRDHETSFPAPSCLFVSPGEDPLAFQADSAGLQVLCTQFPKQSPRQRANRGMADSI